MKAGDLGLFFSVIVMGCAHAQNSPSEDVGDSLGFKEIEDIEIKEYTAAGSIDDIQRLSVALTTPSKYQCETVTISSRVCTVTGCVLPGLDPHGTYAKECQDGILTMQSAAGFLAVLMDGHGNEGQKVVTTALSLISAEFPTRAAEFESNPEAAITNLLRLCDERVKSEPSFDCSVSGSTAVMIYGNAKGLHIGSVGDSRAILGATAKSEPETEVPKRRQNKHYRPVKAGKAVEAVQLTVDQKPNHVGEMDRIQKAGGRVAKITDEHGREVGPYRVWQLFGTLPGLAMSRSIGDKMGSKIGVISTPIFNYFPYYPTVDLFVVVASDGVWDAMTNGEVVNFVEKYRKTCPKCSSFTRIRGKITPQSTTIAHLLCEEARYRWLGICEEEDVMIDDISCIIIELPVEPGVPRFDSIPERSVGRALSLCEKDDPTEYLRGKHVDSRGTLVDNEAPNEEEEDQTANRVSRNAEEQRAAVVRRASKPAAARNDFLRGSIARDTEAEERKNPEGSAS